MAAKPLTIKRPAIVSIVSVLIGKRAENRAIAAPMTMLITLVVLTMEPAPCAPTRVFQYQAAITDR